MIPHTWHYTCPDSELETRLEDTLRHWSWTESQFDSAKEEYKRTGKRPVDLDTLLRRCQRYADVADTIEEEIRWRESPQDVITEYASVGMRMMYLAGNGMFADYDSALSEARFYRMRNEIMREEGPDDSYERDMLKPEDMVSVCFVSVD
jgi:hypothetical protein